MTSTRQTRLDFSGNILDWVEKFTGHTHNRANFLWRQVQFDVAEVVLITALWCNILHQLYWAHTQEMTPIFYKVMEQVLGADIYTALLLCLGVMGIMSFMLYIPQLRREINLAVSTYFVVTGIILLLNIHSSLLGVYHIVIFGGAGAWTYWRQGLLKHGRS